MYRDDISVETISVANALLVFNIHYCSKRDGFPTYEAKFSPVWVGDVPLPDDAGVWVVGIRGIVGCHGVSLGV